MITKHPQNQIACVRDNVTITCGFYGLPILPNWIIGNRTFGNMEINNNATLYVPIVNNTNDTVLIVLSVSTSFNGTASQCEFQTMQPMYSSVGKLTIMGKIITKLIICKCYHLQHSIHIKVN